MFHPPPHLDTSDLADVLQVIRVRILRHLERRGVVESWHELTLLKQAGSFVSADYAKRAALPADITYSPAKKTLAFFTAGRPHSLLFVFELAVRGDTIQTIEGRWAASRAPGAPYEWNAGK